MEAATSSEALPMEADEPTTSAPSSSNSTEWTQENRKFMMLAFEQAMEAMKRREVPIGCIIVRDGEVVGKGFNLTNETRSGIAHAEFFAIDQVLQAAGGDRDRAHFERCALYVTCEPCIMCAGALSLVGMGEVYFGCANDKFGGCGSVLAVQQQGCGACAIPAQGTSGKPFKSRGGLYAEQAIKMLQDFYVAGNPHAPKPHRGVVHPLTVPDRLHFSEFGIEGDDTCQVAAPQQQQQQQQPQELQPHPQQQPEGG